METKNVREHFFLAVLTNRQSCRTAVTSADMLQLSIVNGDMTYGHSKNQKTAMHLQVLLVYSMLTLCSWCPFLAVLPHLNNV